MSVSSPDAPLRPRSRASRAPLRASAKALPAQSGSARMTGVARILVTEELSASGLAALAAAGHEVEVRLGLSPEELTEAVPGAAALVIRSATKVTSAVLEAATDLVVVGRAGIGLDNVDVVTATRS